MRRVVVKIKPGKMPEAVALLQDLTAKHSLGMRIYVSSAGVPWGTLCYEMDFDSLSAIEGGDKVWGAAPDRAEFMDKWREVSEGHAEAEIWNIPD